MLSWKFRQKYNNQVLFIIRLQRNITTKGHVTDFSLKFTFKSSNIGGNDGNKPKFPFTNFEFSPLRRKTVTD